MLTDDHYAKATQIAISLEDELKHINRWQNEPLSPEKFQNMGAFGINTMAFEEWIQFVLIPRIYYIVAQKDPFPSASELGTHALREFDGDSEVDQLIGLLHELDDLIVEINGTQAQEELTRNDPPPGPESIQLGSSKLPDVVYSLIEVLHKFEGDDLESQLQTYDTFLQMCSPQVRLELSQLMKKAASKSTKPVSRMRIEEAARSVLDGGRAAPPYDHLEAMRKYREQHEKNFRDVQAEDKRNVEDPDQDDFYK